MADWPQFLITIFVSILASSGFWAGLQKRSDRKSASSKLILAIARERIIDIGMKYVARGWLTKDEYDDYVNQIYAPYSSFGGNGLAEKFVKKVSSLPIRTFEVRNLPVEVGNKEGEDHSV